MYYLSRLASAVYKSAAAIAQNFQTNLQRCVEGAARGSIDVGLPKVVLNAIAKEQLVAKNLFVGSKDGLSSNKLQRPPGAGTPEAREGLEALTVAVSAE